MQRFGSVIVSSLTMWFLRAAAMALLASQTFAADLQIGDAAPDFNMQGSDDKVHKLSDYRGQTVVLAWFPKAFTEG